MARHNVADVDLCRADALRPVTRDAVVLLDPARRSGGRRRFDPRDYTPALDALLDVYRGRDIVVKCAPGIDFDAVATVGIHRRDRGDIDGGQCARGVSVVGGTGCARRDPTGHACSTPGRRSPTPNPTTARSRRPAGGSSTPTARSCARVWCATTRPGTVCGNSTPTSPTCPGIDCPTGVRGFEVLEELAYSERRLRQALSARDVGAAEILVRGVDVDPDVLRRRLRLRGSQQLSVVITRLGAGAASRATAFICRPSR